MKHSKTTPINFPAPLRVGHDHDGEQDLWLVRATGGDIVASCQCPDAAAHIVRCVNSHEALVGALKRIISENALNGSMSHDGWQQGAAALRLAEANEDDIYTSEP
jgi:hypothetical protein